MIERIYKCGLVYLVETKHALSPGKQNEKNDRKKRGGVPKFLINKII